jgi:hypothetical protein
VNWFDRFPPSSTAKLFTKYEARRIAANVAKLPELLQAKALAVTLVTAANRFRRAISSQVSFFVPEGPRQ